MSTIRLERLPVQLFNLGLFGFDHLQLVLEQDPNNPLAPQDGWYVLEGTRDTGPSGIDLGAIGADGITTLSDANSGLTGGALVDAIGTPATRGSRIVPLAGNETGAWQQMANLAADIETQHFPYIAFGLSGSPIPTINSTSLVATLLFYVGADIAASLPFGLRFSPGASTLLGTSGDDTMAVINGFTTLVGGEGNDVLHGSSGTSDIDKLYGGAGDDILTWSSGFNILHGGQTRLAYTEDGTDTVDYSGAGVVHIDVAPGSIPHYVPDYVATFASGTDHLFSIEKLTWNDASDEIILGRGVGLIESNVILKMGQQSSSGKGDSVSFAGANSGLSITASDSDHLFVQSDYQSQSDAGVWVESAEWLTGSAGNDRIYTSASMRGVEGGEGSDIIDARLAAAFSGNSPQGYDIEILGGGADDTIVSGTGRTLATGGTGADRFVLSTVTLTPAMVEFVIADAEADDRLYVPYDFFGLPSGDFDGSTLMPLLGAISQLPGQASFADLPQNLGPWVGGPLGRSDFFAFQWQTEEQTWYGDDQTQGLIDFTGDIFYNRDGSDLLIHVFIGEPFDVEDEGSNGLPWTHTINVSFADTETVIRVKNFEDGDLGIHFYDIGTSTPLEISTSHGDYTVSHFANWNTAVAALTDTGAFLDALPLRPTVPAFDPNPAAPPAVVAGTSGDDTLTVASGAAVVNAGAGNDDITTADGDDTIDGGSGDDHMAGGLGDDTYVVDSAGDVIAEAANSGFDTVRSSVSFVLAGNVEHLELVGTATTGTGNALRNRLIGNESDNVLIGLGGNDVLFGGQGNDTLNGGQGSDTYTYLLGDGDDVILDLGATSDDDELVLSGILQSVVSLHRLALSPADLVLDIEGGGRILIAGFLDGQGIERVVFDDLTEWSRATLETLAGAAPIVGNEAPQAADDLFLTTRSGTTVIPMAALTGNDRDYDGDSLSIVGISGVSASAIVTLTAGGDIRLETAAGFEDIVRFTYTLSDGQGNTDTARAEVGVVGNAAPTETTITSQQSPEDTAVSFALPTNAFADPDGDRLTLSASLSSGAPLPAWLAFDPVTRLFSGTPPQDFNGILDIRVTATDGWLTTSATFQLAVTPVNDNPVALSDAGFSTPSGTPLVIAPNLLLANDSDVDGDTLSIVSVQAASNGLVALDQLGNIVFTPSAGYSGAASFTYTVSDGHGGSASASVGVTVGSAAGQTFVGTHANETFVGTSGDDVFKVTGDGGTDIIDGAGGIDMILGSAGNDTIRVTSTPAFNLTSIEIIDGGQGYDRILGTSGSDVINLAAMTLTGIELIDAAAGADTVVGTSGDDIILGGAGSDTLSGGLGNDVFLVAGDDGLDALDGGSGFDTLRGGATNDTFRVSSVALDWIGIEAVDGGAGYDRILGTAAADSIDLSAMSVTGIERIDAGAGDDSVFGTSAADVILGGAGNDTLNGNGSDDIFLVIGDDGTDTIDGGAGFDTLLGSAGNDVFRIVSGLANWTSIESVDGGGGFDRIIATAASDTVDLSGLDITGIERIDLGAGDDTAVGTASNDTIMGGAGNDTLFGGDGDDTFEVSGDDGTDIIAGGNGYDVILGGSANDVFRVTTGLGNWTGIEAIDGGAGTNRIVGSQGDEVIDLGGLAISNIAIIDGGAGNDRIHATAADETLRGGAGADTFVFASGFGHDVVADFQRGSQAAPVVDVIDLRSAGYLNFAELQSHMEQSGTDTLITIDAANTLRLNGITMTQLKADDFLLV